MIRPQHQAQGEAGNERAPEVEGRQAPEPRASVLRDQRAAEHERRPAGGDVEFERNEAVAEQRAEHGDLIEARVYSCHRPLERGRRDSLQAPGGPSQVRCPEFRTVW
jgi:hypothetical protein